MTKETLLTVIKFGFAGGSVALLHLFFVYFLTSVLGVWYLVSTTLSYTCAIFLNFFLQKVFVYKKREVGDAKKQFSMFMATSLTMLFLNTVLMYVLVGVFVWNYLMAQVLVVFLLAVATFFINRNIIFR